MGPKVSTAMILLMALALVLPVSAASVFVITPTTTALNFSRIKSDVGMFSSIRSRFTGYPGSYEAAGIIADRFRSLGLNVFTLNYTTLVPLDTGSSVMVSGRKFVAYSLYPNVVVYGPKSSKGRLVDGRDGSLASLNGIDVNGSVVLLDFNSGDNWLNVVKLGATAVVFHGGEDADRSEALEKISSVPINIPRVYVEDAEASDLIGLTRNGTEAEVNVGMKWEDVKGVNVVGEIKGTEDPSRLIIIVTHYDSASVVPGLSRGAEDSIGLSTMLELARILATEKPRYTVWFLATSGHWQALAGARAFVEDFYFHDARVGTELFPYLAFCIDLSSGSTYPNLVLAGELYHTNTALIGQKLSDIRLLVSQEVISKLPGDLKDKILSTELSSLRGLTYDSTSGAPYGFASAMAFRYMLDQEPFCVAGSLAVGAITIHDTRPRFFSLSDTVDRIDMDGSVLPQVQFVELVVRALTRSDIKRIYSGDWSALKPIRVGEYLTDTGFTTLVTKTVTYDPLNPNLYSSVADALVVIYEVNAPFFRYIYRSNASGVAVINGLVPTIGAMAQGRYNLRAYKVDDEGRLTFAPDDGPHGAGGVYARSIRIMKHPEEVRTVLFECGTVVAMDITPPTTLQAPSSPDSLYNPTNAYSAVLFQYAGYESPLVVSVVPFKIEGYAPPDSWGTEFDADKSVETVYVPPDIGLGLIIKVTSLARPVGLLVNATLSNLDGYGFVVHKPGDQLLVRDGLMGQYKDLMDLAVGRYESQKKAGVLDPMTTQDVDLALNFSSLASDSLGSLNYVGAFNNGLLTWGFAQVAYTASLGVLKDSVTSVIIAFALAIPFVILFTALIYGLSRGSRSLVFTSVVAIAVALILSFSHPGFALAANVPAIFMGVVIISLILPALFFLFVLFSTALSEVRRAVFGEHFLERSGFDVSFSAISVGLGNMRKRPLRTVLTMSSIVLVSFALSSLTSVSEMRLVTVQEYGTSVQYNGVLLHTPGFFPLDRNRLLEVASFLGASDMSERYWVYLPGTPRPGVPTGIRISSGSSSSEIVALAGVSPVEVKGSFANSIRFITSGSMFVDEDESSCLLPIELASYLDVSINDIVRIGGVQLRVRGIYNSSALRASAKDSDGLTDIAPLDYNQMLIEQRFSQELAFSVSQIVLIPSGIARKFPEASLTSVFVPIQGQTLEDTLQKVKTIFSVFDGMNFYLTWEGKVYVFSKQNSQSVFGLQFLLIPLVMAGLVTMSTVLGGVMERLREAGIYSSLGLAPLQVGLMFLTENIVYAIVGGILGYLGGMSVSFVFKTLGILGVVTNYTSLSVALAIGTIIVLVVLASVYPMYRVALIVTPSLERRWRIETKPKGDVWDIPIPFRVKDDEKAMGIAVFLREYLWNKRVERAGDFTVEEVSAIREEAAFVIKSRVWLPPYEENIRHDVEIVISRSKTELKYLIDMRMKRVSGAYESWVRFSYPFVDDVRKQLLMWSLLTPTQEQKYIKLAKKEFGEGGEK